MSSTLFQPGPAAARNPGFVPGLRPVSPPARPAPRVRAKLWQLNASVHCSVVGTCLTTAELRGVMAKAVGRGVADATDHDLHSQAVGLSSQQNACSKLLNKALDRRHAAVVNRFARLHGQDAVMALWEEFRRAGDIPGAYWAVLTHPDVGQAGLRRAFGDVHMLSHLVGAANRADIRRLAALEAENAALQDKVVRQQQRLQDAVTHHAETIRRLETLAIERSSATAEMAPSEETQAALHQLVDSLQRRLDMEVDRRARLERRLADGVQAGQAWERRATAAETEAAALRRELDVLQASLSANETEAAPRLPAERVLYVGGHPGTVEQARDTLAAAGGELLSHDGGRHDHPSLLAGLITRADRVVFPVDCVSHDAALQVKRLCRQLGKPWVPLRSAGHASFLACLSVLPDHPAQGCCP